MEKINLSPDWVFSPQPMYIIGTKMRTVHRISVLLPG